MNLKYIILNVLASLLFISNSLSAQVQMPSFKDSKQIKLLNGTWKFKYIPSSDLGSDASFYNTSFDLSKWANIKVPGNWELQGFAEPSYGRDLKEGTGLYVTDFVVPANWGKNPIYIAFDGVQNGYSLWVNGKFAGEFASAFNRQTFDISKFVNLGKTNTLAVKVSTQPKGWEFDTSDDWSLSGIFRNVTLFSLPQVHLKDVTVKTFVNNDDASITIDAVVEKKARKFPKNLKLYGELIDAKGKIVGKINVAADSKQSKADLLNFKEKISLKKAQLWSAENPYLYTLRLSLKDNNTEIQRRTENVGIREISWKDGILKLNGAPIKLRGINHHDLSPVNGRAITDNELLEDLKLMHEANINFIRTSHYPPQPRLLELCDSLGFYVMDEVPFCYGDENLKDKSYLDILINRAKYTLNRDKNHPSIIVWSLGNENPVTDSTLKVASFVKQSDATRPTCFPQKRGDFEYLLKNAKDSLGIYSSHYPNPSRLKGYADEFDHPMIVTEYAHSLGLDMDQFENLTEILFESPKLAGGAIWMFADQGIVRKTDKEISLNESTDYAWIDSKTFYDTKSSSGTDGIVYSNRVPQEDYWEVRKVFSPVKIIDTKLTYSSGEQNYSFKFINRYDFTNLSETKCKWELMSDDKVIDSGNLLLNCQPHDTVSSSIKITLPEKPLTNYYYLKLSFTDKESYQFYEKTFPIELEKGKPDLIQQLGIPNSKPIKVGTSVKSTNYVFDFIKNNGQIQLKNQIGHSVIAAGPFLRVGRKATMAHQYMSAKTTSFWNPYLLIEPKAQMLNESAKEVKVNYIFTPVKSNVKSKIQRAKDPNEELNEELNEKSNEESESKNIEGQVRYTFNDNNQIAVNYNFTINGKGKTLETGIAFLIPSSLTEFRWVGNGPYQAYPGKELLNDFGIHHLNSEDIYFQGNRQNVQCAVFSDKDGNGFALIANKANISVERTADGIVVSQNNYVSGRFNKFGMPEVLNNLESIKEFSGNFTIVPLTGKWSSVLENIFGDSKKTAKPFQPFYHSYDQ